MFSVDEQCTMVELLNSFSRDLRKLKEWLQQFSLIPGTLKNTFLLYNKLYQATLFTKEHKYNCSETFEIPSLYTPIPMVLLFKTKLYKHFTHISTNNIDFPEAPQDSRKLPKNYLVIL